MPTIRLNLLALQTFDRLMATIHFLEVLDKAIPDAERQDQEALRRLAEEQQWDFGDYSGERQIIEGNHRWLPRFAAYSVVILLYSIVETQLLAVAERVGTNQGSTFRVTDIRGRGIEQTVLYLKRAEIFDVKKDPAWKMVHDLQKLRNIIVHRGGRQGASHEQQKVQEVQRLDSTYRGLSLRTSLDGPQGELWISMDLCRDFTHEIQEFFKRLFGECGLSIKGVEVVK